MTYKETVVAINEKLDKLLAKVVPVTPVEPVVPPVVDTTVYTGPYMRQIYWPNIWNNSGWGSPEKYAAAIVQNQGIWLDKPVPNPEAVQFIKDWPRFFDATFKTKYAKFFK